MSEQVLAIVVTYNPELSVFERAINGIAAQDCDVLFIDNASDNFNDINYLCDKVDRVKVVTQEQNNGLGSAHNRGIAYAREHRYDYVLILDQDSMPMPGMLEQLLKAHRLKSSQHQVSAVGVTYLNSENGNESFFVKFGALKFTRQYCQQRDQDACVSADFLISSGSLVSLSTFETIGVMDETLFIDHIDTEWFLRARANGYRAFGVCDARMQHALGEQTHRIKLFGRLRNVPQHRPFRYYYIFRNSILLYKRGYVSALWKWNDLQRLGMISVMFGLIASPRRANLRMMLRGIWDGLRGVSGPMKDV